MKRTYYLFNPGRLSRKDNTLCIEGYATDGPKPPKKYLPVHQVEALYVMGSLDANSAIFNFLGQEGISVHFFDYYEHYRGSFQPKRQLLAGRVLLAQATAHQQPTRRVYLAKQFIEGASYNMRHNVQYYMRKGRDMEHDVMSINALRTRLEEVHQVPELMGVEGNIRQVYYDTFPQIAPNWDWAGRQKQPPTDPFNALISFSNMLCYTQALDAIRHTQLDPTISFLHEPGERRYSLALDLAEVFKPVLVDRMLFSLMNRGQLHPQRHFEYQQASCWLNIAGKKVLLAAWEERLHETVQHKALGRKVSYKKLLRMECYKIVKYLLGMNDEYLPYHHR